MALLIMYMENIKMEINYYKEDEFLKTLNEDDIKQLKSNLINMVDLFNEELAVLYSGFSSTLKGYDDIYRLTTAVINWGLYKIDDDNLLTKGFINRFEVKLESLLNRYIKFCDQSLQDEISVKIRKLYKILINKTKKLIFKFFLCKNPNLTIIKLEELCFYHLAALDNNIEIVCYKKTKLDIDYMQKTFNLKIYKSDEIFNCNNSRLDIDFNKTTKLKLNFINNNYNDYFKSKSNFIDLRLFYDQDDYHPNIIDLVNNIKKNIEIESELNIVLPIFLETNSELLDSNNHGYLKIYFEYYYFYKRIIQAISSLRDNYFINIIIPNSMNYEDYLWWYVTVKEILEVGKEETNVKVGVVLDDFSMIYDIEKYASTDFVVIDFDELSYNLEYDNNYLTFNTFKEELEIPLRDIREVLKSKNIKHLIKAYNLNDENIIEKLIIMGFKDFVYPQSLIKSLNYVIDNYLSRRGKYIGINKKK